jgi:hypothetical protein
MPELARAASKEEAKAILDAILTFERIKSNSWAVIRPGAGCAICHVETCLLATIPAG